MKKNKRFVLGDIHGELKYLEDVLKKSGFDYENDLLIQIGDVVDRGLEPFKCMDELLKIKNLVLIKGNHDDCFMTFIKTRRNPLGVFGSDNGTEVTHQRWYALTEAKREEYINFVFNKMKNYHITDDNIMFVHGGFNRYEKLKDQDLYTFLWDRELVNEAWNCKPDRILETLDNFKKIYIGHTPTLYYGELTPIDRGGVCNIDTGSGKGGPLTIMDIDSNQFWQSDCPEEIKKYVILQKAKNTESQEA